MRLCSPTASGLLLALVMAALPRPGVAAADCLASTSIVQKRWAEAERILRENLTRPACSADPTVRYTLAYAVHQLSRAEPARACEAEQLYVDVLRLLPESEAQVRAVAARYRDEVGGVCGCQPPTTEVAEGRLMTAVESIDARLRQPACAATVPALLLARARVLDRLTGDEPSRACDAAEAYRQAARVLSGPARQEARGGARKMTALCTPPGPAVEVVARATAEDCAAAGDEDRDGLADCADPDCREAPVCAPATRGPSRLSVGLMAGAGLAALAGGGLYYGAQVARDDTREAGRDLIAAGDDADAQRRAELAHADAEARISGFNAGWITAAVVAAGLGVGAALTWGETVEITPQAGTRGVGVTVGF